MPDWEHLVRARLGDLNLGPERNQETIAELAAHLEDLYEDQRQQIGSEEQAVERALHHVNNWPRLARGIRRARREEDDMNARTRNLWLPGMTTLALAWGLLSILWHAGVGPRVLPMGAPQYVMIHVPWLVALPVVGAVGAYWSRRVGGKLSERLLAGLFPVACIFGLFLLVMPWSYVVDRHIDNIHRLGIFGVAMLNWVLIPGAALLLGVLPFVRNHSVQSTSV